MTLIFGFAYIGWRYVDTINLGVWSIALPLIIAETHNVFGLLLFTLALWDIDSSPPWRPIDTTHLRVAVLIPTFNEPEEVLLPTIAGALAMQLDHETWVLDDGKRPEVQRLAVQMSAHYLTRPDNSHYKAGNLNHAMDFIEADIFASSTPTTLRGRTFCVTRSATSMTRGSRWCRRLRTSTTRIPSSTSSRQMTRSSTRKLSSTA